MMLLEVCAKGRLYYERLDDPPKRGRFLFGVNFIYFEYTFSIGN